MNDTTHMLHNTIIAIGVMGGAGIITYMTFLWCVALGFYPKTVLAITAGLTFLMYVLYG